MDVDKGLLKVSIKTLNNSGLAKFQVDSKQTTDKLVSDFMSAVETVPVDKEDELPEAVADMYNMLADMRTLTGDLDIADVALEARQKKEEMEMKKAEKEVEVKKEKVALKRPTKEVKPVKTKPAKETKPVKETKTKPAKVPVIKASGEFHVRPGSKFAMAIDYVRKHPGATSYNLKQQPWNDKNDSFRNLFILRLIPKGVAKKEGKGFYINEGF